MNKAFGLDIGATTIKVVSLSRAKDGFLLNSSFISPTFAKGMLSESALDQEEMAKTIRRIVDSAKITDKNVNVALADNQVYSKVIDMPILSDKELASAIYWEAEQYIPVPLSTISLVWSVLKRPQNLQGSTNEKMQVLMVGAPTTLIDKYQKILSLSGLNITAIETEVLAAVRALTYKINNEKAFPPTIIINIGAVSTSLAIVKDNTLIFTYTIPTGGMAISRSIEADLGLSQMASEEYKKVYGISKENVAFKIGKAALPILNAIVTEVKKALSFYSQKYGQEESIQQILLSGGTAKLPGIELFFAENLGIEVALANPWKILASQQVPKEILDNAPDYTIAVGLAMRDYE